jgi:8-oxo-dGTP diphosphatase
METSRQLPTIHVVAAVLHDGHGRVLIAERPVGKPLAGFWEFPGGKLETGELPYAALRRELHEELGITVDEARPLIRFTHAYPERQVELDVWRVMRYSGELQARERQSLAWVKPGSLPETNLLPADLPITQRLRLPPLMLVTPAPGSSDTATFLSNLQRRLAAGIESVQLRAPGFDAGQYRQLARQVIVICHEHGARILLNAEPQLAVQLGADGVHLTSRRLLDLNKRPVPTSFLIGASCHDAAELEHAQTCELDYAMLGPVLPTASHPDAATLGWERFAQLSGKSRLPVYAIGGMQADDLERIQAQGGYGLAAIRGLWNGGHESR